MGHSQLHSTAEVVGTHLGAAAKYSSVHARHLGPRGSLNPKLESPFVGEICRCLNSLKYPAHKSHGFSRGNYLSNAQFLLLYVGVRLSGAFVRYQKLCNFCYLTYQVGGRIGLDWSLTRGSRSQDTGGLERHAQEEAPLYA
jgi:hypothetical protein